MVGHECSPGDTGGVVNATHTIEEVGELLSRSGKLNAPRLKKDKAQSKRDMNFLKIAFILRR
jgi:hypothetical protein